MQQVELTDGQRSVLDVALNKVSRSHNRGALLAQISASGETMDVMYLTPTERSLVGTVLENIQKRRAAQDPT